MQYVHRHKSWLQFDGGDGVLRLTRLYLWFRSDFEQVADSVSEYAARFVPELDRYLDSGKTPRLEWLEYDWSLKSVQNAAAR